MKDGIRYLQWKPASSVTSPPSLEVWAALRVTEAPGQDGLTDALAVGEDWSAAQVSRAVNASAMLSAYMSALQDDMAERMAKGKPTGEEWRESVSQPTGSSDAPQEPPSQQDEFWAWRSPEQGSETYHTPGER